MDARALVGLRLAGPHVADELPQPDGHISCSAAARGCSGHSARGVGWALCVQSAAEVRKRKHRPIIGSTNRTPSLARATARVEREAPDSKDTATFLRRARAASLKAKWSRFGALAEEEYDKIAPVIACTLPALTDSIPERKRGELAGEVTSELQVVGKAASSAILTWMRNNDKTKARAEEREKNIG